MDKHTTSRWLRLAEAAEYIGLSPASLRGRWRNVPGLARAAAKPMGRVVVFDRFALDAFMDSMRVVRDFRAALARHASPVTSAAPRSSMPSSPPLSRARLVAGDSASEAV